MAEVTFYEVPQEAVVAALIVAARLGLPTDVQELLLHGEVSRGIPPGILQKMLLAGLAEVNSAK